MSYGAYEFIDDIMGALDVSDGDSESDQADLCLDRIDRLDEVVKAAKALRSWKQGLNDWSGPECERMDKAIAAAEEPIESEAEEDDEDEEEDALDGA